MKRPCGALPVGAMSKVLFVLLVKVTPLVHDGTRPDWHVTLMARLRHPAAAVDGTNAAGVYTSFAVTLTQREFRLAAVAFDTFRFA